MSAASSPGWWLRGDEGDVMATSPMAPAGWYADPAGRHEKRYWDGTGWTAGVSDGGVAGTDPPGSPPTPLSERPAGQVTAPAASAPVTVPAAADAPGGAVPVTASSPAALPVTASSPAAVPPAAPATAGRRRRKWVVPVAVIAGVMVLGLVAGLVIWAPWKSPPLLRPTGLAAGPSTTSSVAFRWAPPATGPAPDKYVILHDGTVIGSVRGTVTSYRITGLAPATPYRYRVAAVRGGKRSALSAVLVVRTVTPPVSAARFQGPWTVSIKIVKGAGSLKGSRGRWAESWLATPKCAAGACAVLLSGRINGFKFKTTLTRAGDVYRGKMAGNIFPCGSGSISFPIRSRMRIRITVTAAHPDNLAWTASSWAGTMAVAAPYTSSGNYFCTASHQTLSLAGSP
jgi:hypothetical protein